MTRVRFADIIVFIVGFVRQHQQHRALRKVAHYVPFMRFQHQTRVGPFESEGLLLLTVIDINFTLTCQADQRVPGCQVPVAGTRFLAYIVDVEGALQSAGKNFFGYGQTAVVRLECIQSNKVRYNKSVS